LPRILRRHCASTGECDVDPEAEHEQAERNQDATEEYARGFAGGVGCLVGGGGLGRALHKGGKRVRGYGVVDAGVAAS